MAAGNNSLEETFGLVAAGKFRARMYRNIHKKRPLIAGSSLELSLLFRLQTFKYGSKRIMETFIRV